MNLGIPGLESAEPLGSGGFGTVYRARQRRLNRTVAVKILPRTSGDKTAELRFQREASALGTLATHPNIVTVYDSGLTTHGEPYLIMEMVTRGSLADLVVRDGPVPWSRALEIGVGLASALASAHHAGILHRDIKPENVLLSEFGDPMLADFGIARVEGQAQTGTATITGSAAHLAPELLHGQTPSVSSDIYALGSTLFHVLAGQPAFVRSTDQTIAAAYQRILTAPVPDLRPQDIPDEVCDFLELLLTKDPAGRPADAEEVGEQLRALQRAAGLDPSPLLVRRDVLLPPSSDMPEASSATTGDATSTHQPTGPGTPATSDASSATTGDLGETTPAPKLTDTGTDAQGRAPLPPPPAFVPPPPVPPRPDFAPPTGPRAVQGGDASIALDGPPKAADSAADERKAKRKKIVTSVGIAVIVFLLLGALDNARKNQENPGVGTAATAAPTDASSDLPSPASVPTSTDAPAIGDQPFGLAGFCDFVASPTGSDEDDGTPTSPVRTITTLMSLVEPGSVACLAEGTYPEPVDIPASSSGTSDNLVSLIAIRNHVVNITGQVTIAEGASFFQFFNLRIAGSGQSPAMRIAGTGVNLQYLTFTNRGGPCLAVTAPQADGELQDQINVSDTLFFGCGTRALPAVVAGNSARLMMRSSVFHNTPDSATTAVGAGAVSKLLLMSNTFIGHSTPVQVSDAAARNDRVLTFGANIVIDATTPAVVLQDGPATKGQVAILSNCISPADGTARDSVALTKADLPTGSTLEDEVFGRVQLNDPSAGDYTQTRDSECDGYGISAGTWELRAEQ